jgi:hypothetical protein
MPTNLVHIYQKARLDACSQDFPMLQVPSIHANAYLRSIRRTLAQMRENIVYLNKLRGIGYFLPTAKTPDKSKKVTKDSEVRSMFDDTSRKNVSSKTEFGTRNRY